MAAIAAGSGWPPDEEQRRGRDRADQRADEPERRRAGPRPAVADRADRDPGEEGDRRDQLREGVAARRRVLPDDDLSHGRRPRRGSTARRAAARDRPRRSPGRARPRAPSPAGRRRRSGRRRRRRSAGRSCAARCRSWRTATIVRPSRSFRSASSSMTSTWWRMSRWTVGSSRTRTGAAWATATASSTSWRSPSDSSRASRPTRWPSPTRSIAAATAARSAGRRPRSGSSCGSRPRATTSSTAHRERQLGGCGTTAIRRAIVVAVERRERPPVDRDGRRPSGARTPVSSRSSVDLPAPFGPTSATRSPRVDRQVDVAQHGPRPVPGGDAAEGRIGSRACRRDDASQLVPALGAAQQEQEERRADDRGDHPDRDLAEHPRRRGPRRPAGSAPQIAESGRTSRAFGPTSSRTTCGTTSPTNPIRPLIATAAAVTSEARPSRIARSRRTSTPRWAAASSPSSSPFERPGPDEDQDRPDRDQRDAARELAPRRAVEAAEQVREDLAQVRAGQVHRHRQRRGEQRADA